MSADEHTYNVSALVSIENPKKFDSNHLNINTCYDIIIHTNKRGRNKLRTVYQCAYLFYPMIDHQFTWVHRFFRNYPILGFGANTTSKHGMKNTNCARTKYNVNVNEGNDWTKNTKRSTVLQRCVALHDIQSLYESFSSTRQLLRRVSRVEQRSHTCVGVGRRYQ